MVSIITTSTGIRSSIAWISSTVETRLLFATIAMPRAVLLALTFLLGLVAGLLVSFLRKRRR